MTAPIIQIPTLRPTDVVREPGLDPNEQSGQMSRLAQLLMLKGHLALEQEKFQAEEQGRKDKKNQLGQASTALSGIFNSPDVQTPSGMQRAYQQMLPIIAGLGEPVGPAASQLPRLQEATQQASTQSALGLALNEFANGNVRDPSHQAEFLSHVMAISPGAVPQAAETLKPLQTTIAFHMIPGVGLWAGPAQGTPDQIRQQGRIIVDGTNNDPAAKQRQSNAAALALQRMSNLLHNIGTNPDANIEPTAAAGAENLAQSGIVKAGVGALGALGIGAGTPAAIAQTKRTPAQQNWQRDADGFSHAYFIWVGGTPRSNYLYQNIRNSFFPGAEASPAARAAALSELKAVQPLLLASMQGKKVDFTKLPFFNEIQHAEAQAGGAGQPVSDQTGAPAAPITAQQLLNSVPR